MVFITVLTIFDIWLDVLTPGGKRLHADLKAIKQENKKALEMNVLEQSNPES